jgi:hypothetical protein
MSITPRPGCATLEGSATVDAARWHKIYLGRLRVVDPALRRLRGHRERALKAFRTSLRKPSQPPFPPHLAEGVAGGEAADGPRYIVNGEEQEPPVGRRRGEEAGGRDAVEERTAEQFCQRAVEAAGGGTSARAANEAAEGGCSGGGVCELARRLVFGREGAQPAARGRGAGVMGPRIGGGLRGRGEVDPIFRGPEGAGLYTGVAHNKEFYHAQATCALRTW